SDAPRGQLSRAGRCFGWRLRSTRWRACPRTRRAWVCVRVPSIGRRAGGLCKSLFEKNALHYGKNTCHKNDPSRGSDRAIGMPEKEAETIVLFKLNFPSGCIQKCFRTV